MLLAALCIAGCQPSTEGVAQPYTAEDEALYLKRFEQLFKDAPRGEGLGGYDIVRDVAGAPDAAPLPVAGAEESTISAAALSDARDYAAANNSTAFIVWRNQKLETVDYFGDVARETPLVSRSLAKPLGVIAVARAVQTGYIKSIDQPVADFITEWRSTPKADIKIRYLLDMRSGLLPQAFDVDVDSMLNRAYLHPRHDEIIINEYPLTHEPGTRYEYSNANSELVSPLIRRATGMSYADWVSREVLQPLGALGGAVWINREDGVEHAGCCILLPAETWLRLAILLIQDGVWEGRRLLPEGFVQAMQTPTPANPHAGMGVYIAGDYVEWRGAANPEVEIGRAYHSEAYLDPDLFLFDGNSNQVVFMAPSRNLIALRLGGPPPKSPQWDNAYLPNTLLRGISD
ncbi:MAG: beta-lactamase family protein [Gammaproteobacteria bacterium]|nr:beta-lactamase family protein [Gammaproteobacteria bacterium]